MSAGKSCSAKLSNFKGTVTRSAVKSRVQRVRVSQSVRVRVSHDGRKRGRRTWARIPEERIGGEIALLVVE